MGADESGTNSWYAMFRNGGREMEHMVVAWMDLESAENETPAYVKWDLGVSEISCWELLEFPRSPRDSYFKDEEEQTIEYHWVWEDFTKGPTQTVRKWSP